VFERFRENFELDDKTRIGPTGVPSKSSAADLPALLQAFGGCSFQNGLYRIILPDDVSLWRERLTLGFPDYATRATPFGFDWLGRVFALDSQRIIDGQDAVLMFEPGTGEVLEIPGNLASFHKDELVDEADAALAASFYKSWRMAGGAAPNYDECIGYMTPLFLGGADEFENLEVTDLDVYWHVHGQLILRVRSGKS